MGRTKIYAYISADGFTARIDGDIDWMLKYLKGKDYGFMQFRKSLGGVIFDERHYRRLQSYDFKWPYGDLPCYIITRHPIPYTGGRNIHSIIIENGMKLKDCKALAELRAMEKDLWLAGDKELVAEFLKAGLIDDVTLIRLPVTLGNGQPLAGGYGSEMAWKVTKVEHYSNDVIRIDQCWKRRIAP